MVQRARDRLDGHPQGGADQGQDAGGGDQQELPDAGMLVLGHVGLGNFKVGLDRLDHGVDAGLEGLAVLAVGVVIAERAGIGRRGVAAEARQFATQGNEFIRFCFHGGEFRQFARFQPGLPFGHQAGNSVELFVDAIGVFRGFGRVF